MWHGIAGYSLVNIGVGSCSIIKLIQMKIQHQNFQSEVMLSTKRSDMGFSIL